MPEREPGDVSPDEYAWEEQFFGLHALDDCFPRLDAGKVRGLAFALKEARSRLALAEEVCARFRPRPASTECAVHDWLDALGECPDCLDDRDALARWKEARDEA